MGIDLGGEIAHERRPRVFGLGQRVTGPPTPQSTDGTHLPGMSAERLRELRRRLLHRGADSLQRRRIDLSGRITHDPAASPWHASRHGRAHGRYNTRRTIMGALTPS
ncbi:hypothetical protein [Krasilnikovia cinnamomea]|uniref:hypothetical protein n=1 Tax=Krasilnikovia cinnamomea TaxID=349313 RepID=UPI001F5E8286|nr:hypothetical protein [Krasilnikovia cinnamomea]